MTVMSGWQVMIENQRSSLPTAPMPRVPDASPSPASPGISLRAGIVALGDGGSGLPGFVFKNEDPCNSGPARLVLVEEFSLSYPIRWWGGAIGRELAKIRALRASLAVAPVYLAASATLSDSASIELGAWSILSSGTESHVRQHVLPPFIGRSTITFVATRAVELVSLIPGGTASFGYAGGPASEGIPAMSTTLTAPWTAELGDAFELEATVRLTA